MSRKETTQHLPAPVLLFAARLGMFTMCGVTLLAELACRGPGPGTTTTDLASQSPSAPATAPAPAQDASINTELERNLLPLVEDTTDRWLHLLEVNENEPGAWATGAFDPERNKIDIDLHGARAFAIDTDRIPIDWDRLVILGIDGRNSELRKRDYSVLRFARDDYGRWVVVEPE